MKVAEKVFLLTGAGGGVGAELALALITKGARVAAIDFREEPLAKLEKLAGSHVETFLVDITDQSAVLALPQAVAAKMGQVDGLINNAGIISLSVISLKMSYSSLYSSISLSKNSTPSSFNIFLKSTQKGHPFIV